MSGEQLDHNRNVESLEYERAERSRLWDEKNQEIDGITDRLGMPIDNGIKEAVIGLNLFGLTTSQSCEGHLDRGLPAPWIYIQEPGMPEERFIGENEAYEHAAQQHGVPLDEIKYWETDRGQRIWEEAWYALCETNPPLTHEFRDWETRNTELRDRAAELLREFYNERGSPVDPDAMLVTERDGRVHNGGDVYLKAYTRKLTDTDRLGLQEKIEIYQAEMNRFADFLKEKYLKGVSRTGN